MSGVVYWFTCNKVNGYLRDVIFGRMLMINMFVSQKPDAGVDGVCERWCGRLLVLGARHLAWSTHGGPAVPLVGKCFKLAFPNSMSSISVKLLCLVFVVLLCVPAHIP